MDTVDDLGADIHRRVESECHIGAEDVVVDGLGKSDHVKSLFGKHVGGLVSAVAAKSEEAVQFEVLVGVLHFLYLVHLVVLDDLHHLERGALGTEDSAALGQYSGEIRRLHALVYAVDKPVITIVDTDYLHIVLAECFVDCLCSAAYRGIKSRAVAAARQHSYS